MKSSGIKKVLSIIVKILPFLAGALVFISVIRIPTGLRIFLVESGSMRPAIPVGAVVLSHETDLIKAGDIITFKRQIGDASFVTHRVKEVRDGMIFTQGDANNARDDGYVLRSQVLGKVIFALPYLGYLLIFIKTLPGTLIFIGIPAIFIILEELRNIKRELGKDKYVTAGFKRIVIAGLILFVAIKFASSSQTANSFYVDRRVLFKTGITTVSDMPSSSQASSSASPAPQEKNTIFTEFDTLSHILTVTVGNLDPIPETIDYQITYDADTKSQGIAGSAKYDPAMKGKFDKPVVLGTCSGIVCVYDAGVKNVHIVIILHGKGDEYITLSKDVQL